MVEPPGRWRVAAPVASVVAVLSVLALVPAVLMMLS
jgi:hypothetical protein